MQPASAQAQQVSTLDLKAVTESDNPTTIVTWAVAWVAFGILLFVLSRTKLGLTIEVYFFWLIAILLLLLNAQRISDLFKPLSGVTSNG